MHAQGFILKTFTSVIHKKRLNTFALLVDGLLHTKQLSVTELGRGLPTSNKIQEISGIKRADRFIGNQLIHGELKAVSVTISKLLIGPSKRPKIIVDWTHIPNTKFYAIRAALVTKSRALTLYEEVHLEKNFGTVDAENKFLDTLYEILPADCQPIIITDAGFRSPWFRKVLSFDWNYVGRVRGTHKFFKDEKWISCTELHSRANKKAKCLGEVKLCRKQAIPAYLYLLKEKRKTAKSRKKYNKKNGKKGEINYRKSAIDPWILASSLAGTSPIKIKRVIDIYKSRMQIEEGFRDLKSPKYGFGLRNSYSRSTNRVLILLIIAMMAALIAWMLGNVAEKNGWTKFFQVNTIKSRRVLSLVFLGCRIIQKGYSVSESELDTVILEINQYSR